jgi:plastocyanin
MHTSHHRSEAPAVTRRISQLARLVAVPALLALGTLSAPTVSAGNPCFHGYQMPPSSVGSGTDIKLMPCSVDPTITQVGEGTEVTFINGPDYTHLITGANQAWGSPDVEVQPNASVSYTFEEAGIYPYACALHPGMSGAIVVGDVDEAMAVGSTEAGAGPDTTSASATSDAAYSNPLPLVAVGVGAGLVAGAAAAWLAIRRRVPARHTLVRADSN